MFVNQLYLDEKQQKNSMQILNHLHYLFDIRIKKWEIFDAFQNKKVWVHYLCIEESNFPISSEDYEILKTYGVKAIIV